MSPSPPQQQSPIAWIDGRWGRPAELSVPLTDRGLQLADGLFETVLVEAGRPQRLDEHLQRWRQGAALLAMAEPPDQAWLTPLIEEAIARAGLAHSGSGALRLAWTRGDNHSRGIELPADSSTASPRFWLQLTAITPAFAPCTAIVSRHERRNADSRLSRCKTLAYAQAIQARHEARQAGVDEALLLSTDGSLCCGSTANLLVHRQGRWLTPAVASGCLAGVMRGRALELGLAAEARLEADPQPEDRWLLINSLGCRPLKALNGDAQPHLSASEAEAFWRRLL
ncbi:aminotransferase class IV [Synechococcus sp. CBW1006]|uniref:aminotransferase class IV n=1 Tax=Synechococcus sp. CBW1006 TaxID=1353138 RepID=UPI0018CDC286|nr:aminotransferase class IV [Synechococcus sp. CBW1006]QPN67706.1 aminotransferase class IV [Synechococcus sp. CBW1006]